MGRTRCQVTSEPQCVGLYNLALRRESPPPVLHEQAADFFKPKHFAREQRDAFVAWAKAVT